MSTIQDVAKEARVSVATVSRVINNNTCVTEDTKERVLDAIKKLNYQPNLLGRNLRRMETRLVLVLLPNISNHFYSKIVKGIEDVGHKNGYNVMLCNTDLDKDRENAYVELLKKRLADGIIFLRTELTKDELSDLGSSYPVVQCCEYIEGAKVSHVSIDNKLAAYKVVNHLINQGHKKIALISCKNNYQSTSQRNLGYRQALAEAGIEYKDSMVKYGDYSFKSGIRAMKEFLSLKEIPSAVFCISDMMGFGAVREIKEQGFKVPEDIAVAGFDNISFSTMYDPPLTTMSQHQYDQGCVAMELLLQRLKGELKEPIDIILEHELIIRKSTLK